MRQSQLTTIRRNTRSNLHKNIINSENNQLLEQQFSNIDSVLETLDNSHALAYLKKCEKMSINHHCLRANLAHQLSDHQYCLSFVRQCLQSSILCKKCIQIFLQHHKEHQNDDHKLRIKIIKSIQEQNQPELSTFLQNFAVIAPSFKLYKQLSDKIWLIGGQLQKIMVMQLTESNRKIIAKRPIHSNEQILFIPKKMLITLQLSKTIPLVENLLSQKIVFKSPKHNQLTIFILYQLELGQKSAFYHYLSILPRDFKHFPIYYTQQLLNQLKGSLFLQQIRQKKDDLKKDYDLIVSFDPSFQRFSYQSFVNIRLLVSSRVFGIIVNKIKTDAMVPYADMLNHHLPKQTSWFYCNQKQGFVIKSLKNIPLGAEIFDSYGQKCNSRFLLNYGFTLEQNNSNEVAIEIHIFPFMTLQRESILIKLRISKILQSKSFQQMISTFRVAAQQKYKNVLLQDKENIEEVLETDFSIDKIKQHNFKSRQNQIESWKLISNFMTNQLKQYKDSLSDDRKLLQTQQLDANLKNIIILRKGQKQIYSFYQRMAKKMIRYLSGQKIKDKQQYQQYTQSLKLNEQLIINQQ